MQLFLMPRAYSILLPSKKDASKQTLRQKFEDAFFKSKDVKGPKTNLYYYGGYPVAIELDGQELLDVVATARKKAERLKARFVVPMPTAYRRRVELAFALLREDPRLADAANCLALLQVCQQFDVNQANQDRKTG